MSIFDRKRLTNETFKLDIERMRRGWYSDKYFANINIMLVTLAAEGYMFSGENHHLPAHISPSEINVGDIEVEMQWFTRRIGTTVVVGVDKVLAMLRHCTGYFDGDEFVDTSDQLQVWAVHDGETATSDGDPLRVQPVLKVRGRYRDFALLETPSLGILTRASRVSTNVYETSAPRAASLCCSSRRVLTCMKFRRRMGMPITLPCSASTWIMLRRLALLFPRMRRVTGGVGMAEGRLLMRRLPRFWAILPKR